MAKYSIPAILILLLSCMVAGAQTYPAEGSQLSYRIVGFSFPATGKAANCKIEIANGSYFTDAELTNNLVSSVAAKNGKAIAEVPLFGSHYTWRVVDAATGKTVEGLHHFSTLTNNCVDTSVFRLRILKGAARYADGFVFNDGNRTLYNMKGEAVWFLPNIKGVVDNFSVIRDLKVTPQHTITFLVVNMAYEMSYDGELLWTAPNDGQVSGDQMEHYHHEFTRLPNGHRMILGHEVMKWEWKHESNGDSSIVILGPVKGIRGDKQTARHAQFGTIIEYDTDNKVIWSWKSSRFHVGAQLKKMQTGPTGFMEPHENSFSFDQKNQVVYVSYKNIGQVLKIRYPEGAVLNEYNGKETTTGPGNNVALFSDQHACRVLSNGDLCLYNNNMANMYAPPGVIVLRPSAAGSNKLKKVWEYVLPDEQSTKGRALLTSGGNVAELAGGDLFVSSCTPYSHVFIVTRDKKLLWNAMLEKREVNENKWKPFPQYRASMIRNKKEMEQLIWMSATDAK